MNCRMSGCERLRSGHSPYCHAHRQRQRRHGTPDQPTITIAKIRPLKAEVCRWLDRRSDPTAWAKVEARWNVLLDHARDHLAEHDRGRPTVRWKDDAMRSVVAVANDAKPRDIIATVCAVVLLRHREPSLFKSDRAFLFQLARLFRALTDQHAGEWYNHETGKNHRVYLTPPARSSELLGQALMDTLGAVGLYIATDIDRARAAQEREKADLWAALGSCERPA
ncbi:hypothetical protein CKO28_06340 [Rhodovibrio sodomensis]|uniref:Uncharacterized protein n=1 Tax=Rhodovibrio sodomensis TaxID=1088 RepID=A0ABS1DB15_9PROT|nr:hypothetical protein [Rhodovibrio sodomensis]